ncbi:hypothetical protein DIU31_018620 [Mucilaginibacter rubeus]|uniref:Uncharacterized protein n=1 Tax=Mucilaginibacter rubeus TaxID=2027860 RepID=A0AAE6MJ94_9SPHI|nr:MULTISPECIES: hypothetical protein [Mucilaginibacter]QEM05433.1 hypothetical protein DIU31_018620 [Mucilaginibacter rubeus]QEM18019.1 hypothetical protein DIU38_018800 [Mucilaginibacter gossypii]QTE45446.1 hypothetical protein J3L19_08885 [Mucilaginibacter rubeus]QTE52043.1 hypothetical protein J3L21_08865 [Mucilaginibacter rubeus]QTE63407.1 hypothetical protein J3L22_33310 [Mucilaginibacter rubeus]
MQIIPLLMLLIAPALQILLSAKRANGLLSLRLGVIAFLMFMLGMIISAPAVFISMSLLPSNIKCATGCVGLLPLEFLLLIFTTPAIYTIYVAKLNNKKRSAVKPPIV